MKAENNYTKEAISKFYNSKRRPCKSTPRGRRIESLQRRCITKTWLCSIVKNLTRRIVNTIKTGTSVLSITKSSQSKLDFELSSDCISQSSKFPRNDFSTKTQKPTFSQSKPPPPSFNDGRPLLHLLVQPDCTF